MIYQAPPKSIVSYISKLCALSLKAALAPLNLPITFKHPNDLMINKKKLSGIMSEVCEDQMITSIGLNLTQTDTDLSPIDQPATSLFLESGKLLSTENIIKPLLQHFPLRPPVPRSLRLPTLVIWGAAPYPARRPAAPCTPIFAFYFNQK